MQATDETKCIKCKDCAGDAPNQYNSVYRSCNGSDTQDVVVCALNPPTHAMVGDTCPEGHFAVGMLTAIDGPLRQSIAAGSSSYSAAVQFTGIVPFVHQMYPSVRIGTNVMVSMSVTQLLQSGGNTSHYARIIEFAVSPPVIFQ